MRSASATIRTVPTSRAECTTWRDIRRDLTAPISDRRRGRRGPCSRTSAARTARATRAERLPVRAAQPDLPAGPAAQPLERRRHRAANLDAATVLGPLRDRLGELREPLRGARDRLGVGAVDPHRDQPAVRRVAELRRARRSRRGRSSRSRAPRRRPPPARPAGRSGSMTRPGRSPRPARPATCASSWNVRSDGAEVREVEPGVGAQHADQRHARGSRGPWSPSACRRGRRPRAARPARARPRSSRRVATSRSSRATRACRELRRDRVGDLLGAEALALDRVLVACSSGRCPARARRTPQ